MTTIMLIAGLVLLVAWLRVRGSVPESVDLVATAFSQNLGLLFVPAAVGGEIPDAKTRAGRRGLP